jgi:nicotinate-nucleotide adenylyltransferase
MSLQKEVAEVFQTAFGTTPMTERLDDIHRETYELLRYLDVRGLKGELGDLLSSCIMLAEEMDLPFEDLVRASLEKIKARQLQYKSLGRKYQVAIVGFAADPPTLGHLRLCQYILNTSRTFDEIFLMPCNSHMHGKQMAPANHRLKMCEILVRNDRRIKVSDFEIANQLSGATYNTVKRLLEYPEFKDKYNFSWVIGMDNANTFHTWVDAELLERTIRFVVVPRQGVKRDESVDWYLKPPHIYLGDTNEFIGETSSSAIRANLPLGHPALDDKVWTYIMENSLYYFSKPTVA